LFGARVRCWMFEHFVSVWDNNSKNRKFFSGNDANGDLCLLYNNELNIVVTRYVTA